MGKRLLYQNSMEETLQQLLQDREQQLMQINRELQHLPGGSLHIRKRNGRIFVCEYSNGREKSVTREKDRVYRLARKAYLESQAKKFKEECNWLKRSIAKLVFVSWMKNFCENSISWICAVPAGIRKSTSG